MVVTTRSFKAIIHHTTHNNSNTAARTHFAQICKLHFPSDAILLRQTEHTCVLVGRKRHPMPKNCQAYSPKLLLHRSAIVNRCLAHATFFQISHKLSARAPPRPHLSPITPPPPPSQLGNCTNTSSNNAKLIWVGRFKFEPIRHRDPTFWAFK